MGERVACPRRDRKPGDGPALELQPVADIIETECVRQLRKHHRRQMAPPRVAAGPGIYPMLPGGGLDGALQNILEKFPPLIDMMAWPRWAEGDEVVLVGFVTPIQPRFPAPPPHFSPATPSPL